MPLSPNATLALRMAYWKFDIKLVIVCVLAKEECFQGRWRRKRKISKHVKTECCSAVL